MLFHPHYWYSSSVQLLTMSGSGIYSRQQWICPTPHVFAHSLNFSLFSTLQAASGYLYLWNPDKRPVNECICTLQSQQLDLSPADQKVCVFVGMTLIMIEMYMVALLPIRSVSCLQMWQKTTMTSLIRTGLRGLSLRNTSSRGGGRGGGEGGKASCSESGSP